MEIGFGQNFNRISVIRNKSKKNKTKTNNLKNINKVKAMLMIH